MRGKTNEILEYFKNDITEQEKEEFRAFVEEHTVEGKPSAEAVVEYIRGKGYEVTEDDLQPLDDDDLENVSGGLGTDCDHEWEPTGNEKDDSYFIFWRRHYIEVKCIYCGAIAWMNVGNCSED